MDDELTVPRGVRLGLDVGKVRIGVAASDPDGLLAMPVETVRRGQGDLKRLTDLMAERAAVACYLGLPKHLRGTEGESAQDARKFAARLAGACHRQGLGVDFFLLDERLSSVTAVAQLHEAGRNTRQQRAILDQQAAVNILQVALDSERVQGRRAGSPWMLEVSRVGFD